MAPIAPESYDLWPELPLQAWEATRATLHMWTQIVGKTRLALTPLQNHWWNVTLYPTARGLSTSPMPYQTRTFEVEFDFVAHNLAIRVSDGSTRILPLAPKSVAAFYAEYRAALKALGLSVTLNTRPCEVPDPIPFERDETHSAYDPEYANRFWRILVQTDAILKEFRCRFVGKSSPVHFFWGSFDMALTFFSGRKAPPREGADAITREAYSHEVISCGFWPDARFPEPAFYCYAAPAPPDLGNSSIRPEAAFYSKELGEFLLPYEAVRTSAAARDAVLEFAESTFENAARLGRWDPELVRPRLTRT